MGTYSLQEVKAICDLVEKYQLDGRDVLKKYSLEEIAGIYNGAGPDSWIELAREVLTSLMSLFKPVIMIHDLDFNESDGAKKTFQEVTDRWIKNCRIVLNAEYPLWTWKMLRPSYRIERAKWWAIMEAGNLAISSDSAFEAWIEAYQRKGLKNVSKK